MFLLLDKLDDIDFNCQRLTYLKQILSHSSLLRPLLHYISFSINEHMNSAKINILNTQKYDTLL